jgi:hypothetical protein
LVTTPEHPEARNAAHMTIKYLFIRPSQSGTRQ